METNALLQQVITLLVAHRSAPLPFPSVPVIAPIAPITVDSNTQLPAPNTTKQGASGQIDRFQQLEERLAAMEKRETIVGRRPRPLAEDVYLDPFLAKYKHPSFTKYNGDNIPLDHIVQFESECGPLRSNEKLIMQLFPSSLSGDALRWFNCRPKHSLADWDQLTDQFVAHFSTITEVPIHMEDLRKCKRRPDEDFHSYVQRFRKLVTKMEKTSDVKEIVKICGRNSGDVAVYIAIPPCKSFEELFERMHEYEELMESKQAQKM